MATQRSPTSGLPSGVHAALANFNGLKLCQPQPYFFPDGTEQQLSSLEGTIPVFVKGTWYNIPVTIWLRQNHPDSPPIVYVRAVSGTTIVRTPNVDVDGKVEVDFLSEWNSSSELIVLIQILCVTFSERCPVYSSSQPKSQRKDSDPQSKFSSPALDPKKEQVFEQGHVSAMKAKVPQLQSLTSNSDCFSKAGEDSEDALKNPPLLPLDLHQIDRGGEISSAKIFDSSPEEDNEPLKNKLLSSDDELQSPPVTPAAQNQMDISHIQQQTQQVHLGESPPPYKLCDVPQEQSYQSQHVVPITPVHPPTSDASARPLPSSQCRAVVSCELDPHEFDWEFIDPTATCNICEEPMIEPNLLQCCGNGYLCRKCVKEFRKRVMPCPLCKQQAFKTVVDRNYQSAIQKSQVWCPYKENGCTWSGLFQDAEVHLQECGFCVVSCPNHCIDVKVQQQLMKDHLDKCPLQPIPCPYAAAGCSELIPRTHIPLHLANNTHEHLLQIAKKNHSVGQECKKFEHDTKAMYARIEKGKEESISKLKEKITQKKKAISKLEDRLRQASTEIQQLNEQQEQSTAALINVLLRKGEKLNSLSEEQDVLLNQFRCVQTPNATYAPEVPTVFTLDHFSERKANNEQWISPPFYTHTGGYKLRLCLYPNGHVEKFGKSVSIFLHLTRGEFDDQLQWPMPEFHLQVLLREQRSFVISLMDQSRSANLRKNFKWDDATTLGMRCRVEGAGIGPGRGFPQWISHANLGRYLTNDSLCIQVHKIIFLPH